MSAVRSSGRPAIVATTIGLVVFLLIQGILAADNGRTPLGRLLSRERGSS
jgi:hypothetical protein